ncbi:hypothetical protein C8F01DRAFT_1376424 [Mycena amicta]|nr:hypothetical protein C8F01DRAFT_1376424 [Mycena amicta]
MSSDDEPQLPRELEREIFYTAALLHPLTIPKLLRVARRVLIWVEPLLYRTLRIGNRPSHVSQLKAASTKPPEFLARAVQCAHDYNAARGILSLCTGVTGLALSRDPSVQKLLPVLSALPIQRFAGFLSDLMHAIVTEEPSPEEIAAHPLFRCLTHIDLFDSLDPFDGRRPKKLQLTVLTHYCAASPTLTSSTPWILSTGFQSSRSFLPFPSSHILQSPNGTESLITSTLFPPFHMMCESLEPILKICRSLRILAVLTNDEKYSRFQVPESLRDPRFVLCKWRSWCEGVEDGTNHWTIAEDFVARKQRGEVDENVFGLSGAHNMFVWLVYGCRSIQ